MNPVALYLASGESLYPGAIFLTLIALGSATIRNRWLLRLRNLLAWASLAMMLLACVPYSWPMYAAFVTAYLGWFVVCNLDGAHRNWVRRSRWPLRIGLAVAALSFAGFELPHRTLLQPTGEPLDHLIVIGDSVSSGINAGFNPWPDVFHQETGIPVTNLSRPGIGVDEAIPLAAKVDANARWILLEIGGNDLLSDKPATQFESELSDLLSRLARPGRHLVMFELPLLPHKIAYGCAQRALAKRFHVTLIPKRLFIDVLNTPDATSDGLHLSPSGTHRMSELVRNVFDRTLPHDAAQQKNGK